ncbi:MAG: ATP-dependent dethiobiotin synthetase BioD [Desulfobulbaceae bacterium]|nr:ATP-dependent dethiobiotin synthetase BioD [Desulfobulbaceae bacterium]
MHVHEQVRVQTTIAVAGIDTGVGKSYCAGLLARYLLSRSESVSTMKLVQTGCSGIAEDILLHRRLMAVPLTEEDQQGSSNPYVFKLPASPHLAATLEGKAIVEEKLNEAVAVMQARYQWLVLEGAGGLLVPLNSELLLLDYLAGHGWPLVLVSSPRLGSINHTRLSLEAIRSRGMQLLGLVYNLHGSHDPDMVRDTLRECRRALRDYGFTETVVLIPDVKESAAIAWSPLLTPLQ